MADATLQATPPLKGCRAYPKTAHGPFLIAENAVAFEWHKLSRNAILQIITRS